MGLRKLLRIRPWPADDADDSPLIVDERPHPALRITYRKLAELRWQASALGWEIAPGEAWYGGQPVYGLYTLTRPGRTVGPMRPDAVDMFLHTGAWI